MDLLITNFNKVKDYKKTAVYELKNISDDINK